MKRILLTTLTFLCGVLVPSSHAQTAAPAKPGELVNGDFSQGASKGLPTGWSFTNAHSNLAGSKPVKIPGDVTIARLQEGSKAIVRITYKNNCGGCIAQVLDVPPKSKQARLKVSVRGTPDVKGARYAMPDVGFRFFNSQGKLLPVRKGVGAPKQLSDKSWQEVDFTCDVPPDATSCNVILGNANNTNGTFDWRGASVRFR